MNNKAKKLLSLACTLAIATSIHAMDLDDAPVLEPENQAAFRESMQEFAQKTWVTINAAVARASQAAHKFVATDAKITSENIQQDLDKGLAKSDAPASQAQQDTPAVTSSTLLPVDKTGEVPVQTGNTTLANNTNTPQTSTPAPQVHTHWYQKAGATIAQPFKSAWSQTGAPACEYVSSTQTYKKHPFITIASITAVTAASAYGIWHVYKYFKNKYAIKKQNLKK